MTNKVAIFYNPTKAFTEERGKELLDCFRLLHIEASLAETEKTRPHWESINSQVSLVIILGGDGSFLAGARRVYDYEIPILGINYGHLGFLSDQGEISMQELAEDIKEQKFIIESRSLIQARLPDHRGNFIALNEIAINRSYKSNLLYTDLYIDDDLVHSFRADGIVVSTPTGSTAYALSAGGAVMDPNIRAFQIVPIAAHSLSSRPHIISDEQTIVLMSKDKVEFYIQADGQELVSLPPGSKIEIKKSPKSLKLVKLKRNSKNFYSILRDKMKWGFVNN
jgi:NAD+ kinase